MLRVLTAVILVALAAAASADGPGTQIRAGPPPPQPVPAAAERDLQRCDKLRDEAKRRCERQVNAAAAEQKNRGPEATGAGSGAGSGASSTPR